MYLAYTQDIHLSAMMVKFMKDTISGIHETEPERI